MSARLASGLVVSAMVRMVSGAGGFATVLAKGDADSGAILVVTAERGKPQAVYERLLSHAGGYAWVKSELDEADSAEALTVLVQRRRARDPDLWVIELDIPDAERFIVEQGV